MDGGGMDGGGMDGRGYRGGAIEAAVLGDVAIRDGGRITRAAAGT